MERGRGRVPRSRRALLVALVGALLAPALASAHIERASYWPDPAPDCTISPCAGGQVPTAGSLASALSTTGPGVTRVVCQPDSLTRLHRSVKEAKTIGYVLRPTQPRVKISEAEAKALNSLNGRLFRLFSALASASLIFTRGCVGRRTYPIVLASLTERCRRVNESG